jgi:hypothetical protein
MTEIVDSCCNDYYPIDIGMFRRTRDTLSVIRSGRFVEKITARIIRRSSIPGHGDSSGK